MTTTHIHVQFTCRWSKTWRDVRYRYCIIFHSRVILILPFFYCKNKQKCSLCHVILHSRHLFNRRLVIHFYWNRWFLRFWWTHNLSNFLSRPAIYWLHFGFFAIPFECISFYGCTIITKKGQHYDKENLRHSQYNLPGFQVPFYLQTP